MTSTENTDGTAAPAPGGALKLGLKADCTAAERTQLEHLCSELFRKEALMVSGRLQMIGLDKIKKRMGRSWAGFQTLVYDTVEEVMSEILGKGDLYIRYRDDSYIIVFGRTSLRQGGEIAGKIAEEIRQRLFQSGVALQSIDIQRHTVETKPGDIGALSEENIFRELERFQGARPAEPPPPPAPAARIRCVYQPLWDVEKGALTTYLCEAEENAAEMPGFRRDMRILETVLEELQAMAVDGRKLLIICPVRHETLYRQENFEQYRTLCESISPEQRALLVFMITDMRRDLMKMNGCWFLQALRGLGKYVFIDLPFHAHADFAALRQYRFDAAGFRLTAAADGGKTPFEMVHSCAAKAEALGIPRSFVLDVGTLSIATAAACNGVDFMGGEAVHGAVAAPDSIYRYRHENLFTGLTAARQLSRPETSM